MGLRDGGHPAVNEQAANYAGINTTWVRIRAYLISSYCATLAGLMAIFQDKGVTAQYGLNAELIVIAAVIIGGASILGGRGRVIGSCLGALLTVLINKVLREGWPVTRIVRIGETETQVNAVAQLPAGAVPAFIGLLLLVAVLIEPQIVRKRVPQRLWARLRGLPPTPLPDSGGVAIEGVQTKGAMGSDKAPGGQGRLEIPGAARRIRDPGWPSRSGSSGCRSAPITGGICRTASRSCSTIPRWRCWQSG